ncbi:MAG: thiamine phosphate synthase [Hyphomonadaceae bacterium JAD_PAG50586_4]|nr:MAG: thiamine phosphate synthase [Hyphomonadaceae bacterium JAD_PAG50586_4]
MGSVHALAAQARRLNSEVGAAGIPALYFFTDPLRTPDPVAIAKRLPRATAVVYRHFGSDDRARVARQLAAISHSRGLFLLIAADRALARRVGAVGVHWPEKRIPMQRDHAFALETASAHSAEALARADVFGADACVLAPVFETRSASGNAALGLFHASQMARAARLPVIALGGIDANNARTLSGRGFAGLAAVDAFAA